MDPDLGEAVDEALADEDAPVWRIVAVDPDTGQVHEQKLSNTDVLAVLDDAAAA